MDFHTLNKNPDLTDFMQHSLSVVLCPNASAKFVFLETLACSSSRVIYLDFDLLYSGYIASGLIKQPDQVLVRRPHSYWNKEVTAIAQAASSDPYIIIIDSLNGMNAMWTCRDEARLTNHSIMLLAALGREVGTQVIVAAVAKNTDQSWAMLPNGSQLSGLGEMLILEERSHTIRLLKDGSNDKYSILI